MPNLRFTYGIEETFTALDGRNRHKLTSLEPYLSELALDKYRISVETTYLFRLSEFGVIRTFTAKEKKILIDLSQNFSSKEYQKIREIEQTTNHEMKSVEEYIKLRLSKTSLSDVVGMVHFGLTSEDINNLTYALMIRDSLQSVFFPQLTEIEKLLQTLSTTYKSLPMLGRTHGQPALPTTVGKEFAVYYKRLIEEFSFLKSLKLKGKLNGNIGNFNSHALIFPKKDWLQFSENFVTSLGLIPDMLTTQIEPYDSVIRVCESLMNLNNILKGLCMDMWLYISMGYFEQKVIKQEVGSTALPHKVNPIYFEGGEGGFVIANALFSMYQDKFSYSRLQRDLSDSTVRRSLPIAFCYTLLSLQSIVTGLQRVEPHKQRLINDLSIHWEILSEAVQNFLRTRNYTNAYDTAKKFFRGNVVTQKSFATFVKSLSISADDKNVLLKLQPEQYTGLAERLVETYAK